MSRCKLSLHPFDIISLAEHFLFSAHSATFQLQPWDLPFPHVWLLVVENATWKLTPGLTAPLHFLVAQMIKSLPAVPETWVRCLERSPREGNVKPLQDSRLGNLTGRGACQAITEGRTRLSTHRAQYSPRSLSACYVCLRVTSVCVLRLSVCVETMTATSIFHFKSAPNGSF